VSGPSSRIDATVVTPEDAVGADVPQQVELEFDSALPDLARAGTQEPVRLVVSRQAPARAGDVEPSVPITFRVSADEWPYELALLLHPFAHSTNRGT
jgi:hypothetical protein